MEVFPGRHSQGISTYCLFPTHELSTAPMKKPVSDGKMDSSGERMMCAIDAVLKSSLLEQAQYGKG